MAINKTILASAVFSAMIAATAAQAGKDTVPNAAAGLPASAIVAAANAALSGTGANNVVVQSTTANPDGTVTLITVGGQSFTLESDFLCEWLNIY